MPFRITEPAEEVTIVGRCDDGMTWMAHPGAQMQRTSHALAMEYRSTPVPFLSSTPILLKIIRTQISV